MKSAQLRLLEDPLCLLTRLWLILVGAVYDRAQPVIERACAVIDRAYIKDSTVLSVKYVKAYSPGI